MDFSVKKEYFEYICESIRQNKKNVEIIQVLQKRYGSDCMVVGTIKNWICALKSENRIKAIQILSPYFMHYWNEIHQSSQKNFESTRGRESPLTSTSLTSTPSVLTDNARNTCSNETVHYLNHINRVPSSPSEGGLLRLPITPSLSDSRSERSISSFKREPESIIGEALMDGQNYFMIKYKGSFNNGLGIQIFHALFHM